MSLLTRKLITLIVTFGPNVHNHPLFMDATPQIMYRYYMEDGLHFMELLMELNVRSLLPKRDQIEILLHQTNFHILFINEFWIDDLISEAEISVPGYTSIQNDRSRDGGGVLAYIKNMLKFEHLKSFLSTSIESI